MKINFGCGNRLKPGYVNLDKEQCDLEKIPFPFKDKSIDEITCIQVLEHLNIKPSILMNEFIRILKDDGKIIISVPHFSWHNAYDEDHERFFNYLSFSDFHNSNLEKGTYKNVSRTVKIKFMKNPFFWNYLIEPIVNLNSHTAIIWESTFLCYLFPANHLRFEITKLKR